MRKLVSIFYDVREEEWRPVFLMAVLHFILMVVLYFLKPARDSLFLVETGPDQLPLVYIILALVSIPVTYLVSNVLTRYSTRNAMVWMLVFLAVNLLLLRGLFVLDHPLIYMLFYIWVGIFGILVISLFWLLANSVFDAAQSKRLFSFLTLSAILGSIIGSNASSLIVSYTSVITENLLFLCIALLGVAVSLLCLLPGSRSGRKDENEPDSRIGEGRIKPSVVKTIFSSRYQLMITGVIGLTTVAATLTDYQFKVLSFGAYPETESLTAFMGMFYAGISLVSLVIQVLFSSGIIKKWGLSGAVLTRPVGMMVGGVLMVIEPVLASVIILKGFDSTTRYSIDKTGRELLFLPLSQNVKERTKLFIDMFVDRFSRGLSGGLLLLLLFLVENPLNLITYVLLFTLVCWIFLGYNVRKEYINIFRASLQRMMVDTHSIALNLDEPAILDLIKESLKGGNIHQLLHTLILLENTNGEPVARELKHLLKHPSPEVRLRALKQLQALKNVTLNEEVHDLLYDEEPEIRVETIYYLCLHASTDPSSVIKSFLTNDDIQMQSAALGCACKHGGGDGDVPDPEIMDRILNNLPENEMNRVVIKIQLAEALGFISNRELAIRHLSVLVQDTNRTVVKKALQSIARLKIDRMIPTLLQMLEANEYAVEVKKALGSFGDDYLMLYKNRFLDPSLHRTIRKQIPEIFYYRPNEQSLRRLEDMMETDEPELRYHVIKTLNKIHREKPELETDRERVRSLLRLESRNYFNLLAIKAIQPKRRPNSILLRALTEKMDQLLERMFRLLGLIYDQKDLYSSYLALNSSSSDKRSAAVEFIDNILHLDDHKYIFPIVDDTSDNKKMETGYHLFHIEKQPYDKALTRLIEGGDRWLKTCAVYSVSPICPAYLQGKVVELTRTDDPLIRETALMVQKRNKKRNGNPTT